MTFVFGTARRKRTPIIVQHETTECGVAALAMILAHHGRHVPLAHLRSVTGLGRAGTDANAMLRAARRYGLVGKAYLREPHQLPALGFPLIAHCRFIHFVVVEAMKGGRVFLNDPESGPHDISREEFDEQFTGVALTFEPSALFQRGGRPFDLLGSVILRLGGCWDLISVALAATLLVAAATIAGAVLTQLFVDRYFGLDEGSWLLPLVAGLVIAAALRSALAWAHEACMSVLRTRLSIRSTMAFVDHLMTLPTAFFTSRQPASVETAIELNGAAAQTISELAPPLLGVMSLPITATALLWYDPLVGVAITILGAAHVGAAWMAYATRASAHRRLVHAEGGAAGLSPGVLRNIEALKVGPLSDGVFAMATGQQAKVLSAATACGGVESAIRGMASGFATLATVGVLTIGTAKLMAGSLSIGAIVALHTLAMSFMAPLAALLYQGGRLDRLQQHLIRLDDVLSVAPRPKPCDDGGPTPRSKPSGPPTAGRVELRDVRFGYSRSQAPVIDALSLELGPRRQIGILGPPGIGKTTLAHLMCGLHPPWSGQILIDGTSIDEMPPSQLADTLAYVDRDVIFFEGSIEENIRLWDSSLPRDDLIAALADACVLEVVESRVDGLAGRIGPRAARFSAGERQRLEIARALVRNPSIVILDEATDGLELDLEEQVLANIRGRGCGCLLISQRLESIRGCDEIFVLEHGRLVQCGLHEVLTAAEGSFLCNLEALPTVDRRG